MQNVSLHASASIVAYQVGHYAYLAYHGVCTEPCKYGD